MTGLVRLGRRNPWSLLSDFADMRSDIDRFFGDKGAWEDVVSPTLNARVVDDRIMMDVEMPGVDPKKIDIAVDDDELTISAQVDEEGTSDDGSYVKRERTHKEYYRSLRLPFRIDVGKVKASGKNGILHLELPKMKEDKKKKIEVAA